MGELLGPRARRLLGGLRVAEVIGVQVNRALIQYLALTGQIVWMGLVWWTAVEAVRGRASGRLIASVAVHTAVVAASRLPWPSATHGRTDEPRTGWLPPRR